MRKITDIRFAESLAEIMNASRVSPEQMAEIAGVSVAAVYKWLSGSNEIRLSRLIAIANHYGYSLEYVAGRSTDGRRVPPRVCANFGAAVRRALASHGKTTYTLRKHGFGSRYLHNWDGGADPLLGTMLRLTGIIECMLDELTGN